MYDLATDHKEIKAQIKEWELQIDDVLDAIYNGKLPWKEKRDFLEKQLGRISDEMMSINV